MKIDIYNYPFEVLFIDKDEERLKGNDGIVLYNDRKILVRDDLDEITTGVVIRHELVHAIMLVQGRWNQVKLTNEDMSEFVGFQAPFIVDTTNVILGARALSQNIDRSEH